MTVDHLRDVLREHPDGCTLAVRVQPGAKKSAIIGFYGEGSEAKIKIALQAPAIEGRANEALIAYLAGAFKISQSAIRLVQGQTGRSKVLVLSGVTTAYAQSTLQALLPAGG